MNERLLRTERRRFWIRSCFARNCFARRTACFIVRTLFGATCTGTRELRPRYRLTSTIPSCPFAPRPLAGRNDCCAAPAPPTAKPTAATSASAVATMSVRAVKPRAPPLRLELMSVLPFCVHWCDGDGVTRSSHTGLRPTPISGRGDDPRYPFSCQPNAADLQRLSRLRLDV